MRKVILATVALLGLTVASANAQNLTAQYQANRARQEAWASGYYGQLVPGGQPYNPAYGYPTGGYGYNPYGNSAPFQGNFTFPPGYGYGSIYGNSGHPGFHRFTGPAWASPYAW